MPLGVCMCLHVQPFASKRKPHIQEGGATSRRIHSSLAPHKQRGVSLAKVKKESVCNVMENTSPRLHSAGITSLFLLSASFAHVRSPCVVVVERSQIDTHTLHAFLCLLCLALPLSSTFPSSPNHPQVTTAATALPSTATPPLITSFSPPSTHTHKHPLLPSFSIACTQVLSSLTHSQPKEDQKRPISSGHILFCGGGGREGVDGRERRDDYEWSAGAEKG